VSTVLRPPARRLRVLALAGLVALLAFATFYLTVGLDRRREGRELLAMRDTLAALRVAADSCMSDLAGEETRFRRFDAHVDSLRGRVRDFESLHPEGVPRERYQEYMTAFDAYNEAVPAWEARADTLRAHEAFCRSLAERHNALADSLRSRWEAWEAAHSDR
jgi:hypothetical protein